LWETFSRRQIRGILPDFRIILDMWIKATGKYWRPVTLMKLSRLTCLRTPETQLELGQNFYWEL